jgi:hypothetical protein
MNRQNQILIAILAIQIVLGAVVFWPRPAASGAESGPLFADFKPDEVAALTISDGEGNHLALAKSGDNWVLPEAGDYPADGEKITPLLEKIEGVQTNRLVTRTDTSHKRLQVAADEFNRRVELTLQDGDSHRLFVGSSAGAGATHVRADGQSEVYLTGELNSWEANAQASAWIDTLYFTLPQTATVALTLENGNGLFEFEREDESWTMKGLSGDETFNQTSLTNLLSQASSVQMTEPIGTEEMGSFGLDDPLATITLTTADQTYTLRVGAKDENNNYVLSSSESPYYVRVAEYTANNFIEKSRDDFLEGTPTPAVESES